MKLSLITAVCTLLLLSNVTTGVLSIQNNESLVVEGMIIVKLNENISVPSGALTTGVASIDQKIAQHQVHAVEQIFPYLEHSSLEQSSQLARCYYFHYGSGEDETAVAHTFFSDPNIEYAEPKYIAYQLDTPDDPYYPNMTQFPHVQAPLAWDVIKGEAGDVVIAIVDQGTDWNHEDLLDNVWTNPGEIPDNGIDDDANGFIDDVHGWNFPYNNNDPSPYPGQDHGTHTAGTASGVTNNGTGVSSISWNCSFMPINAAAIGLGITVPFGYEAIVYAAANGADVISNSWGLYARSLFQQEVIDFAHANGSLVIAAAGNDGDNFDHTTMYPAGYDHVLSVGATLRDNDLKASFSNYGVTVDVFAPGVGIWSTVPNGGYEVGMGTSMATPMVSGLAGLVKTLHPSWTNNQVGEQVRVTCDNIDDVNPTYAGLLGKGRINALRAVSEDGNPSVRIVGTAFAESGGDGNINAGDTVDVTVDFANYLAATSDISVSLTVADPLINLLIGNAVIPILDTNDSASVVFQFALDSLAPDGHILAFIADIDDGSYTDRDLFSLTVDPLQVVTHSTSLVQASVTTDGNIGWIDFQGSEGIGFLYNEANSLYEGGLLVATSANAVSDCIRGSNVNIQENDLRATSDLRLYTPGAHFNQSSTVDFDDSLATNPIGVVINQLGIAGIVGVPQAEGAIALVYEIANSTLPAITDLHLGLFCDWNVNGNGLDYIRLDQARRMGYVQDTATSPTRLVAVKLLNPNINWSYRSVDNQSELDDGFTEAEKWNFLSGGIQTESLDGADVSTLISAGPMAVDTFARVTIGFCLIGASSLTQLQATVDAVQYVWDQWYPVSDAEESQAMPARFSLQQNHPNPVSGSTTLRFSLDQPGPVRLLVYDAQGRVLRRLIDGRRDAGAQAVIWDGLDNAGRSVPSGVYFYRLDAASRSATRKLILMK